MQIDAVLDPSWPEGGVAIFSWEAHVVPRSGEHLFLEFGRFFLMLEVEEVRHQIRLAPDRSGQATIQVWCRGGLNSDGRPLTLESDAARTALAELERAGVCRIARRRAG